MASFDQSSPERWRLAVQGAVQGIGFRPYVYRLAKQRKLTGWVRNASHGVEIEIQGAPERLTTLVEQLRDWQLPTGQECVVTCEHADVVSLETAFRIVQSEIGGEFQLSLLPDQAICGACRRELLDPANRRYRYPFISCVRCGPRYTIVKDLPFDRCRTTMSSFTLCDACQAEYQDPNDPRFHAQTIVCANCGPQIALWDGSGQEVAVREDALRRATSALARGEIVAVLGIGGFQLLVDAYNETAVQRLRHRKGRDAKPLALMFSSLKEVQQACIASSQEQELLLSSAAPIVLLTKHTNTTYSIAPSVAPNNPMFGALLAYSPLHVLLLNDFGRPVVATSGNRSEEPLCYQAFNAPELLGDIADWFLVHNRKIEQPVDDSVVRVLGGKPVVIRRARGYTPLPISGLPPGPPALAVGGQQKNTIAVAVGQQALLGPHVGDLDSPQALVTHDASIRQWTRWCQISPTLVAMDPHPQYASTRRALKRGGQSHAVQHHYAHVLACMLEYDLHAPVLGISWDGTGLGSDGQLWGGEFLLVNDLGFERIGTLRSFTLLGGEQAIREPRRVALALLFELGGSELVHSTLEIWEPGFTPTEVQTLLTMAGRGLFSPRCSSAGRLFDAFASLLSLRHFQQYEAQAAMELEFAATAAKSSQSLSFPVQTDGTVDWGPAVVDLLEQVRKGTSSATLARAIHEGLAVAMLTIAQTAQVPQVVLTGGCFQNAVLLDAAIQRLQLAGFQTYWPQNVPPNDGGLALGQLVAARKHFQGESTCV